MKATLLLNLLLCLSFIAFAQDDKITAEIKDLYQEEQFDKIISKYGGKATAYPAKAVYYIGMAYYMKEDDQNCLKMMELSISKDSGNAFPYFIKGKTLQYLDQHYKAIESINQAIKLSPDNAEFHSALGDSYNELNEPGKALQAYSISVSKNDVPDRAFVMIPQMYNAMGDKAKALATFYTAKEKIAKESSSYITVLFNIGLYEYLDGNYDRAEQAYNELLSLAANDYHTYAKLIQVYYARKEYVKATPLRDKLYDAYNKGLLKDNLEDMFCFDQFIWNGKRIQIFERFDEPEGKIYYKHIFYVVNENGDIEYSIQTENSPVSMEQGGPKYLIGMRKGNSHYTYNVGVEQNFNYEKLKNQVIDILDDKIKPTASTHPGK
ncbi:tetratricopeptide repeat protein [Pontibacter burrus]|uniref:Tetratricopeptide repeat protein n=1 Tax=Pontibacter burrus TaxID=2704466 RepID=A0A6B3LSZ1_9BACT|nr:tetratricopeptide repeat protein [Pontibacter burrus]NEM96697.1 tetratricopeptide repeat protein [Pontibacter burrus]